MNVRKPVVLSIDDDRDLAEMMRLALCDEGFEVTLAASAFGGMKALAEGMPDIILLDVMMPGVNGLDFCETLRGNAETSHIPVIFVSALGQEADKAEAFAAGAAGYVVKPFDIAELISEVHRHVPAPLRDAL